MNAPPQPRPHCPLPIPARAAILRLCIALTLLLNPPAIAQTPEPPALTTELPFIGLNIGNRNVNPGIFIRGEIDEFTAIDFENWLIPSEAVLRALRFSTTIINENEIELRSPYRILRLNPNQLQQDPQLGPVFTVQEIRDLFQIGVEFDALEHAIIFDLPDHRHTGRSRSEPLPVLLDGLPEITPLSFTRTALAQDITLNKNKGSAWQNRGRLIAVGTILGSSWFTRITQPNLLESDRWQLSEFQILRQTDASDYFIGSQPTFWRNQTPGDFWGFTTIQRQGYSPFPYRNISGGANPTRRLQPEQVTATISGRTEPGTLVQLVDNLRQREVLAEELVDASGIYRFNDVPVGRGLQRNYYLLLFPDGSLAAEPIIEAARFILLPEQLPPNTGAIVASAGWRRDLKPTKFFGQLQDFGGGIAYRRGISEDLTLGIGGIYDGGLYGLAELFYQPKRTPLRLAISGLISNDADVNAEMVWDERDLYITVNTDLERTRYSLNWQVFRGLRFSSRGTLDESARFGLQYSTSGRSSSTILGFNWQTDNQIDWRWYQRLDQFTLSHRGSDRPDLFTTNTQLDYRLNWSEFLTLGIDTEAARQHHYLITAGWQYRSRDRNSIGQSLWQTELGYGIGSQGHGPYALIGTTVIPGLFLEARYETIALRSNRDRFTLQLRSSLGFQEGIGPGERRPERLRTEGGLLIKPFYDFNGNGRRDAGEPIYRDSTDFLIVNNEVVRSQQVYQEGDRLYLPLPPGRHRVDLEEAGFPPDFQPTTHSFAVEVVAGSYTPLLIPLQASYTLMGVVTNAAGEPVAGAKVEAVDENGNVISFSITNNAGVYYLEQLRLGTYQIKINGQPARDGHEVIFDPDSDTLEELNLQSNRGENTTLTGIIKRQKITPLPYSQLPH
ncbi:MAG: carboxypeptidase regulatory-like domain-containing protein [Spirulina sp. DLM2.Bin59]|nr:MAG: carboxypeptidase regulatory-like domain-containing protein [Spirulina sp. DLM2.Bin59]